MRERREPGRMPIKRYHRKSRAGCDTCKRRRVKCDEATPICGACAQRQDPCTYPKPAVTTARSGYLAMTSSITAISSSSPLPNTSPSYSLDDAYCGPSSRMATYNATRMKEMQLMHQWSTVTYRTSIPRATEVFRDFAVDKALQHIYLMDSILAFTSLHSASIALRASDSHEHVAVALHYQNQSITEFNKKQAPVRISKESLDPIWLMTAIHAVTVLVASLTPATPGEQLEPISRILMRIRKYALCLNDMIYEHMVWANSSELKRILDSPTTLRIEEGGSFTAEKLRALTDAILSKMDLDDTATPLFHSTLEKLEKAYSDNNGRSVISWLVMVEPILFQKADMGEAAALVILACWGALSCVVENIWWTKYAGRRIVEELSSQLAGCDSRWDEIVQWCCEQVEIRSRV